MAVASNGFWGGSGNAPSNVILCGRTYHKTRDASYGDHSIRWFLFDNSARLSTASRLSIPSAIVNAATDSLKAINPYIDRFKMLQNIEPGKVYALELKDSPTASGEIAAVLHQGGISRPEPRSVYVWYNTTPEHRNRGEFVSILSPQYEPLQYPILFPHGTPGWHQHMHQDLSLLRYCRLRLLQNERRFLALGRLTNEYLVDMYSRIEDYRFQYLKTEIRKTFDDSVQPDFRLNANVPGSRAWASEQVSDALALQREYGRPSLFVTITTNPNWPEIKDRLLPTQNASDIPTIVARVFKARLTKMSDAISKHMGAIVYSVRVIEFQKRGLPHAHIVYKIAPELPLEMIDSVVSAELPSEDESPSLRAKVLKYNIHSDKHLDSPSNRCYQDGKCVYNFPQTMRDETTVDSKGKVLYRRRKQEDSMVVSYMPFLTELMDCHVHVDVAFTANIFIYLYKYMFKGADRAKYSVKDPERDHVDEFEDWINARYLSASEAAWRIFGYDTSRKSPAVIPLSCHMPAQNLFQMSRTGRQSSTASTLLRYFARPLSSEFRYLTYAKFYSRYIHKPYRPGPVLAPNEFHERLTGDINVPQIIARRTGHTAVLARIKIVSPRLGELFYVRSLLQHRPVYSFEDLRTVSCVEYPTFQEAATAYGLFTHVREVELCIQEAIAYSYGPYQLRFLYAHLIVDLPSPALELWECYKSDLSADYIQQFDSTDLGYERSLRDIGKLLVGRGSSLAAFNLPDPGEITAELDAEYLRFAGRRAELSQLAERMANSMNTEQHEAYDTLLHAICECDQQNLRPHPSAFYIDGMAGRGKSYVASALINCLRAMGKVPVICGSTALSVTSYERGRTAHATFGIPVTDILSDIVSSIRPDSSKADLLQAADLIVWEETPMANRAALECADQLLRDITCSDRPFGGKIFLGVGDFRQVAPVVKNAGKTETIEASVRSSPLWKHFSLMRLYTPIRNASDPLYAAWIDGIGDGINCIGSSDNHTVTLDMIETIDSVNDAIDFLYPPEILSDPKASIRNSFLSPKNIWVDDFNEMMLDKILGQESEHYLSLTLCNLPTNCFIETFFSHDTIKEDEHNRDESDDPAMTPDYLALLREPGIPAHELRLKPGCVCSLMRNLDIDEGLVKNRRVLITNLLKNAVEIRLIDTQSTRTSFCIPRITFEFHPSGRDFTVQRRQFPLRLAYATTFNSCQGLTLDRVVIDLREDVFTHGQLYTAVSRVRHRSAIKKLLAESNTSQTCKNVVYKELLLPTT